MEKIPHLVKAMNVVLFLLLMTPLVFWADFFFPAMSLKILWVILFSEILFFCFAWACYFDSSYRPKLEWPVAVLWFFLALLSLSSLIGVYPQNSVWGDLERSTSLLIWFHLGLVFVVLLSYLRSQKAWQNLCRASVALGLMVALIYFASSFFSEDVRALLNSGSTLGNSSFFGTYLLFQVFFSLFLAFTTTQRVKWFGVISFFIFVFTLFSTDARAAIVSSLGGTILFLALMLLAHRKNRLHRIVGFGLLSLLVVSFFITVVFAFKSGSFFNTWIINHGSGSRFVVWDIAWNTFKERPLLGWGPENFRYAFLEHYDPCFGGTFCGGNVLFDKAHNIILDTLVESGILGLLAYLFLLFLFLRKIWTAYRRHMIEIKTAALVTVTLAAYFVQNLTVFDTATSLLFFLVFYGLVMGMTSLPKQEMISAKQPSSFFPVVVSCLLPFALFFFVIQPIRGIAAVKTAATSLNTTERFDAYSKAMFISPLGRDVRRNFLGLQTVNLLWGYHPVKDAEYIKKIQPYFSKEIALVKQAFRNTIQHSPNDFRAYLYLTKLLHAEGRLFHTSAFVEAQSLLDEAIAKNPKQKTLYWVYVSLNLEQGDLKIASEYAQKAVDLSPDQKRTRWNMFLYRMYMGEESAIQTSLQELIERYPQTKKEAETFLARDQEERKYDILSQLYYD